MSNRIGGWLLLAVLLCLTLVLMSPFRLAWLVVGRGSLSNMFACTSVTLAIHTIANASINPIVVTLIWFVNFKSTVRRFDFFWRSLWIYLLSMQLNHETNCKLSERQRFYLKCLLLPFGWEMMCHWGQITFYGIWLNCCPTYSFSFTFSISITVFAQSIDFCHLLPCYQVCVFTGNFRVCFFLCDVCTCRFFRSCVAIYVC